MYRDYGERRDISLILPIIVLNAVIFLFCQFGGHSDNSPIVRSLLLHSYYIRHGQVWRLVTYQFLHGSFAHIFFNMWGLYVFGRLAEQTLGTRRFLVLYLLSGVIGGLAWLLFNWGGPVFARVTGETGEQLLAFPSAQTLDMLLANSNSRLIGVAGGLIGASGSVFGVMTATAMLYPNLPVSLIFPPITMKMRTMIIIYMVIEVLGSFSQHSSIAHLAHLGGALGGFLFIRKEHWSRWLRRFQPQRIIPPRPTTDDNTEEIQRILQKMSTLGYNKLTEEEKLTLQKATDEHFRRNG